MANVWTKFNELLPKKVVTIGTVDSVDNTNKVSVVTLLSGSQITVRGTSITVGAKCFIEDGTIIAEAPNLPVHNVTIV